MERHMPKPGEKYLHFKQKMYQVICVAFHAETGKKMVVYQALYGKYECFVRPLESFLGEVSREKYPECRQKYRFELVKEEGVEPSLPRRAKDAAEARSWTDDAKANPKEKEEQADPILLRFLDMETLEKKYHLVKTLADSMTDRLIDDFAAALDLVIPDGKIDDRYQQLLSSIRTMQKFEVTRLR